MVAAGRGEPPLMVATGEREGLILGASAVAQLQPFGTILASLAAKPPGTLHGICTYRIYQPPVLPFP